MAPARAPRVAVAIAAVTVAAWLAQSLAGPHAIFLGGFIPARASLAFPFAHAAPFALTPLSATLLHGGLLHIGLNLVMLVFCGRPVESVIGGARLALLYVFGAYAAAFGQYLVEPASQAPMIGASGAISAVLAAYALMFGRETSPTRGGRLLRALWLLLAWTLIQWGISVATATGPFAIATAAHVGGFAGGLALTPVLLAWRYRVGRVTTQ